MLHGALPRAYVTPASSYLSGYFAEDGLQSLVGMPRAAEESFYARLADQQRVFAWTTSLRAASPCPLDLSLKTSGSSANDGDQEYEEELVVDDDLDSHRGRSPGPFSSFHGSTESLLAGSRQQFHAYQQQLLMTPTHQHPTIRQQHQVIPAPMTPPSTPSPPHCPRKRPREENSSPLQKPYQDSGKSCPARPPKKKHARKLKFDEDTSSPVSGTVILGPDEALVTGDIDPAFNIVEVTEEARAELAKIENRLGPYQCKLCRQLHDDAFQLAQHRCSRIAHVEYRCPECDKRFSCPANLASHRRWHKPRPAANSNHSVGEAEVSCKKCDAKFTRQAALRKHLAARHPEFNDDNNNAGAIAAELAYHPNNNNSHNNQMIVNDEDEDSKELRDESQRKENA